VQLHELLGQRQPEPRALLPAGVVPADLAEFLEDGCLVLGRNSDPRVGDRNLDDAICGRRRDNNPAPLRREFDGIGEKVQEDLLDLSLVGYDVPDPASTATSRAMPWRLARSRTSVSVLSSAVGR
jgi:hypothetical protein